MSSETEEKNLKHSDSATSNISADSQQVILGRRLFPIGGTLALSGAALLQTRDIWTEQLFEIGAQHNIPSLENFANVVVENPHIVNAGELGLFFLGIVWLGIAAQQRLRRYRLSD